MTKTLQTDIKEKLLEDFYWDEDEIKLIENLDLIEEAPVLKSKMKNSKIIRGIPGRCMSISVFLQYSLQYSVIKNKSVITTNAKGKNTSQKNQNLTRIKNDIWL